MNQNEINAVFSADASENIDVKSLSKSMSFLISSSRGLKQGETVVIISQLCKLDTFDLGGGLKSAPTLCVAGVITDKNGVERAQKFSLAQLKRRTYGKKLKVVKKDEYPTVETSDLELIFKTDEDAETVTLVNNVKFVVSAVETHYVSEFDNKTNSSKLNEDGSVSIVAKQQPIFTAVK